MRRRRLITKTAKRLLSLMLLAGITAVVRGSGEYRILPAFVDYPYSAEELFSGHIQLNTQDRSAFDRHYHGLLAYLHLTGQFRPAHRQLFEDYETAVSLRTTVNDFYAGPRVWRDALAAIGIDEQDVAAYVVVTEPFDVRGTTYQRARYIENCMPDAFATAAATLDERRNRYGLQSEAFQRWLDAQRMVFSNCGSTELVVPAEPAEQWSALEKADRAYQIAASYFYNRQYDEAIRRFQQIAEDAGSPWRDVSRYVIGRAYIRAAKINGQDPATNLRAAATQFAAIANSSAANAFPSAEAQRRYALVQADPDAFLRETGRAIVDAPESLDLQTFSDYIFVLTNHGTANVQDDDMASWLSAARINGTNAGGVDAIVQRWQRDRQPHWLFLAAQKIGPRHAAFDEVVAALQDEPAVEQHYAFFERRLNLLWQDHEFAAVRGLAGDYLQGHADAMTQAERNTLQRYLARTSTNLPELVNHALMPMAGLYFSYNEYQPLSDARGEVGTFADRSFETEAESLINDYFSPDQFAQLVELDLVPVPLKGKIAKAAWVRALLAGDDDRALFFARVLSRYIPSMSAAMEKYITGEDRDFEAAYIILLNPGFSPYIDDILGRYTLEYQPEPNPGVAFDLKPDSVALSLGAENWWCPATPKLREEKIRWLDSYAFTAGLDASQREEMIAAAQDFNKTATDYFASAVLDYAPAHLDDERVPQALHRIVFATRYACSRYQGVGEVSRAAFELLHAEYPDSTWAAQTPYWYD